MARTWQRWVPAVAAPVVVAAVVVGGSLAGTAASADLPSKTPQEVLELAASSEVQAFSGTVEQSSDLGLPDVSGLSSAGGSSGSSSSSSSSSGDGDSSAAECEPVSRCSTSSPSATW